MNSQFGKRRDSLSDAPLVGYTVLSCSLQLIANSHLLFAIFPDNRKSLQRFITWIEKFKSAIQKGGKIYEKSGNVPFPALWSMGCRADLKLFTDESGYFKSDVRPYRSKYIIDRWNHEGHGMREWFGRQLLSDRQFRQDLATRRRYVQIKGSRRSHGADQGNKLGSGRNRGRLCNFKRLDNREHIQYANAQRDLT
jgi:hypothetical protein